ncbi:lantibiotic dehydratase [Streptomyces marincola]|uniref:Lanthionine biosynthesis protein n=1 Tax=Streptomyces marincola TaxID=2878388 RepID=A0A1W7D0U1_9ACTN|nr:lantibiotic dehydratase [Streptomyces marincola]ARQ70646.1 lanthionine biosynthesis protein [Streptomyces marincola]
MYRYADAALIRGAAIRGDQRIDWPDLVSGAANAMSWRVWLQQMWADAEFAAAVTAASPDLANQVERVCAGRPLPEVDVRRTVLAVLRYLLRARTRATPFGLFAGIATARIGTRTDVRFGHAHCSSARADAERSTVLVDRFEQHPALRPHLMLLASNLAVEHDGHVVLEHRPSGRRNTGPEHARIRVTGPVRAILHGAREPIRWTDLSAKLAVDFPDAPPGAVDKLLAGLVRQRVLLTSLRPTMTTADPLSGLDDHAHHLSPGERAELSDVDRPVVDLRLDWHLTLPETVAHEAAKAAKALTRLAPRAALTGWAEWHARFLDRYGPRATVPVLEVVDVLGYPPGYRGSTAAPALSPLPDRDGRLIKLAHAAAVRGRTEIVLDDDALEALATTDQSHPVQPSTEVTVRIEARDATALQRGDFVLHVVGVARSAGATTGRFLDLLPDEERRRMTMVYAELPGVHRDAVVAQLSASPLSVRAQNVARAPQATDLVISLGEYRGSSTGSIPLADLAVTADAEQLHLVSLSRRRPVHTLLLNAVDLGLHSHPLTRFLAEAPVALTVPCTGFLWGAAASHLPFLPALRYGRTVLSPARWLLTNGELPGTSAPWQEWDEALTRWSGDARLPERVYLTDADQRIALDLAESSHRALLRAHLDRHGTATLHPAPGPGDAGWADDRSHEVVIPMFTEQNRAPVRSTPHFSPRKHGHLPGSGDRLYLQLHGRQDRQDAVLTRHVPALLSELGDVRCWFVRYRDPDDHLRIRLTCAPGTLGKTFESIGEWSEHLRDRGLITRSSVETYHPETARFGGPEAIDAAERYFAADSCAALAQLTAAGAKGAPDARAVTAASMVEIAVGLLGDRATAMRWLIEHTRSDTAAPSRAVYRQAIDLVHTYPAGVDERIVAASSARRAALAGYAHALTAAHTDPGDLLPDLLHLHHVRVQGPGLPQERAHLHLARAAALSWTARARRTA